MAIDIHYCTAWGYETEALRVKAWLEARGRGPVKIQRGKSGQFDVVVDGRVVYSRRETGKFPSDADLEKVRF